MQESTKTPEFTEAQWAALAKWLPRGNHAGDLRQTVTAMLYVVRTGVQWEYLPVDLGNPDAVARTWQRWAQAGVFRRAFGGLFPPCDRNLAAVSIDGMYIPVALESHGARAAPEGAHDCPRPDKGCVGQPPLYCPVHQAIGRQIYQSTNLVLMVDATAQIIDWRILPGNFPESWATLELLQGLDRAGAVIADGRHNTRAVRAAVAAPGVKVLHTRPGRNPKTGFCGGCATLSNALTTHCSGITAWRSVAIRRRPVTTPALPWPACTAPCGGSSRRLAPKGTLYAFESGRWGPMMELRAHERVIPSVKP